MGNTHQHLQDMFDDWAREGRGESMKKGHWPFSCQILNAMNLQPGQNFLDLGCGNGYAVGWVAERVAPTGRAIGVDISPEMIELCNTKFTRNNTEFLVSTAESLPFDPHTFDYILSVESLYYHPNPLASVQKIREILKPAGWFAIMVDYYKENPYSAIWAELLPIPITSFSEAEYKALFGQAGLKNVRTNRLFDPSPVDESTFKPGWGYNTVADVYDFQQNIGSLAVWGQC